jgi:hypothetical protein
LGSTSFGAGGVDGASEGARVTVFSGGWISTSRVRVSFDADPLTLQPKSARQTETTLETGARGVRIGILGGTARGS